MDQVASLKEPSAYRWLSTMPAFLILVLVVLLDTSNAIQGQLLLLGERTWEGYYQLRLDPVAPACDPSQDIEVALQRTLQKQEANAGDEMDLFAMEPIAPEVLRESLIASQKECRFRVVRYHEILERKTSSVAMYIAVEQWVADLGEFRMRASGIMLAVLLLICGGTALFRKHHISLRPALTVLDFRVSALAQMAAFGILFYSMASFKGVALSAGVNVVPEHLALLWIWIIGFGSAIAICLYQVIKVPTDAVRGGHIGNAILATPLYAIFTIISGSYFLFQGHASGIGIYINQMMELAPLMLNVALYVLIGMLLKRTDMAQKVFDVFRPFNLRPEMLAVVAVAVSAIPTAYTGGSGIFVIAVGSLVYMEVRRAGARRQLALAATAMSGSLGVVLRPCLLVVIVAALNNEVTTDQLFSWGVKVFLLTTALFAFYAFISSKKVSTSGDETLRSQNHGTKVFPQFLQALKPLIPYVLLISGTLIIYALVLAAYLDEFSAPTILPVLLIVILAYERFANQEVRQQGSTPDVEEKPSLFATLQSSTSEATVHIGALLMLMGTTMTIGGVVERAELMAHLPVEFSSVWMAMLMLVAILVVIGMIMDPYGAVLLVSVTIAGIAYKAGIDPIHFWMVTLVAFELGYLSPPVALNHLLTRQVVGEEEIRLAKLETIGDNFWYRNEKILLPLVTMATALIIVAFGPLLWAEM
ncbi:C4-dicarboxylate ABC transporter [Thalassolituus oleivorans]|uniref:TRAP transporter large permease subunit n=1 Tax=Thalassolituus oleivorans TaxID=187493 RepID=UPI0009492B0A|nr:TRAP transporter large permease subunit [Thalassolituus oleivorans]APR65887.1 C4-dicarboxylate ABC transporter [Thalassolituus oleivorans]